MQISVIMTTYNRPGALAKVMSGLGRQTLPPGEVIVADDGSRAETETLVSNIAGTVPFSLQHVWHADKGFRAAAIRNKAIRRAKGDYLILLDGDCIPDRRFIEDHRRLARRGYFFQGKRVLIAEQRTPSFRFTDTVSAACKMRLFFSPGIGNRHHLLRLPFFPATVSQGLSGVRSCNLALFRDDLVGVNGFNEEFIGWGREDSELVARLYNYGLKRRDHPFMAVCYHLWHPENDRRRLELNDTLLEESAHAGHYFCRRGLIRKKG